MSRPAQGDPQGPATRRPLRKGLIDLPRRAEVSQAANGRYLEALAAVHDDTAVRAWLEPLCRPVAAAAPPPAADPAQPPAAVAAAAPAAAGASTATEVSQACAAPAVG